MPIATILIIGGILYLLHKGYKFQKTGYRNI
jgi:hypothetical protein